MPEGDVDSVSLEVESLTYRYGRRVILDDFSLRVTKPGLVGLLGPNGAGKTTLLRCLAGVLRPSAGSVNLDARAGRIGYLPQRMGFASGFTAREHVEYVAWLNKVPRRHRTDRSLHALATVDLSDSAATPMGKLSGGMRQRVGLAAALVTSPRIVLLDEPTQGLDIEQARRFRELVGVIAETSIVVLSSHNVQDFAHALGARTVVLLNGQKRFDGRLEDIRGTVNPTVRDMEDAYLQIIR